MIDFDELRKEVAIRHNVLLGKDDPVLVTVTLNEIVLDRYLEVLSKQNREHAKALSVAFEEQAEQGRKIGGQIITAAAVYVRKQVHEAVTLAVTEAGSKLCADLVAAQQICRENTDLVSEGRAARFTAVVAAIAAGICAVAAVGSMIVIMMHNPV